MMLFNNVLDVLVMPPVVSTTNGTNSALTDRASESYLAYFPFSALIVAASGLVAAVRM